MRRLVASLMLLLACSLAAMGGSTLYMGFGAASSCATGATGCPIDPNLNFYEGQYHSSSSFSVFQNSGSNGGKNSVALTSPFLLILGIAGNSTGTVLNAGSITDVRAHNPFVPVATSPTSGTWTFGSMYFGLNGYVGYWTTSSPASDVYQFLKLNSSTTFDARQASNSQNLTNWNGTLADLGAVVPSGYGIYTFQINAPLDSKGLIDISFVNTLTAPSKTYVVGYGLAGSSVMSTPFTRTALQFPEPSSWLLLSTAGLAVVLAGLHRRVRGTE